MNITGRSPSPKTKKKKAKVCKQCKAEFEPARPLQVCCGPKCAVERATHQRSKKDRAELRIAKERLKSRGDWAREAQTAFNAFIRARDKQAGHGCISCGSHTGKENAGHYRSVGSCPSLRFEESQVHLQCEKCNSYLSGNLINYRTALILRVGQLKVDWIEGPHQPKHYTIDDLKAIKAEYKAKLKALAC